ncbi:MAG: hypothetical protein AAFQ27_04295 [Pseudomonadota bacterium]
MSETRFDGAKVAATYDGRGRLESYDRSDIGAQTYAYNGLGDRLMHKQRRQLARRLKRIAPENADLILRSADRVIAMLEQFGFILTDEASNQLPLASNELRFERPHSADSYSFVLVTFSDDDDLGFGANFGVREYAGPHHDWHASADLVRWRFGLWKSYDLGAAYLIPNKVKKFRSDWQYLESNINAIVKFLETGIPNKLMSNVTLDESYCPYDPASLERAS